MISSEGHTEGTRDAGGAVLGDVTPERTVEFQLDMGLTQNQRLNIIGSWLYHLNGKRAVLASQKKCNLVIVPNEVKPTFHTYTHWHIDPLVLGDAHPRGNKEVHVKYHHRDAFNVVISELKNIRDSGGRRSC
jgi:hypothetical protein